MLLPVFIPFMIKNNPKSKVGIIAPVIKELKEKHGAGLAIFPCSACGSSVVELNSFKHLAHAQASRRWPPWDTAMELRQCWGSRNSVL
jgi:hypothetical protein